MNRASFYKVIKDPLEAVFGRVDSWRRHRRTLTSRPTVKEALLTVRNRWPVEHADQDDDPIMIFSAGWRSGSTLLQRLALSGNEALVWGEPYPYCDYIRRMAASLTCMTATTPPDQFFLSEPPGIKDVDFTAWTACLYPHPDHLWRAHRAFFRTLYGDPALARGYSRWGLKEVVLSTHEAEYMRWLFPSARFVFLYRSPYEAYRSYRSFGDWYYRWPDSPVFTAYRFGRVWRSLVEDFIAHHREVGGLLLRYEDLVRDASVLSMLSTHLGTAVSDEAAAAKVTGRPAGDLPPISSLELMQLRRAVEPTASRLGYSPTR